MIKELYVIHGWTYTVSPWDKTIALLKEQGITIKMLHVPGLTEPSKKVWTIEEYAKWADQNIPDGAVALGHSNGGRILFKGPFQGLLAAQEVEVYPQGSPSRNWRQRLRECARKHETDSF